MIDMRDYITYAVREGTQELQYRVVRDGPRYRREYPDGSTGECSEGDLIAAGAPEYDHHEDLSYLDDPELDQYI